MHPTPKEQIHRTPNLTDTRACVVCLTGKLNPPYQGWIYPSGIARSGVLSFWLPIFSGLCPSLLFLLKDVGFAWISGLCTAWAQVWHRFWVWVWTQAWVLVFEIGHGFWTQTWVWHGFRAWASVWHEFRAQACTQGAEASKKATLLCVFKCKSLSTRKQGQRWCDGATLRARFDFDFSFKFGFGHGFRVWARVWHPGMGFELGHRWTWIWQASWAQANLWVWLRLQAINLRLQL